MRENYANNIGDNTLLDELESTDEYVSTKYKTKFIDNSNLLLNKLKSNTDINYYNSNLNTEDKGYNLFIESYEGLFNYSNSFKTNDTTTQLEYDLVNKSKLIDIYMSNLLINIVKNEYLNSKFNNLNIYPNLETMNTRFDSETKFINDNTKDFILYKMKDLYYELLTENFNSDIFLGGLYKSLSEIGGNKTFYDYNIDLINFLNKNQKDNTKNIQTDKIVGLNNFSLNTLIKINELTGISISKLKSMKKEDIINILKNGSSFLINKAGGGISDYIYLIILIIIILYIIYK